MPENCTGPVPRPQERGFLLRNSNGTIGREAELVKRPRNDPLKLDTAARLWRERTLPIANRRVRHQTSAFASSLIRPERGHPYIFF